MDKAFENLKRRFEEDPVMVIVVGGFVLGAAARFIDALSGVKGRRAYARQVEHRIRRGR